MQLVPVWLAFECPLINGFHRVFMSYEATPFRWLIVIPIVCYSIHCVTILTEKGVVPDVGPSRCPFVSCHSPIKPLRRQTERGTEGVFL